MEGMFEGETINTPSMLCVEDYLDALNWAKSIGGLDGADRARQRQCEGHDRLGRAHAMDRVSRRESGDPFDDGGLSEDRRSADPRAWTRRRRGVRRRNRGFLEAQGVAYDISAYRDAPPGLRIWCGATVDASDLEALTQWLDYAYAKAKSEFFAEAA